MPHVPGVSYSSANLSSYDVARKRSKFTYLWSVAVAGLAVWSASGPQSFHTAQASAAVSTPGPLTSVFEGWQAPPASSPSGNATLLGDANPATELDVTFGLALQRSDLPELVQSLSTPGTSSYRHYQSVAWLAGHTGATEATSTAVLGYLRSQGVVGHLDPTASYVEAAVSVAQAAQLFGTSFGRYYFNGADGWDTYTSGVLVAPRSPPQLPSALKGRVTLVYGLQAYPTFTVYPNSVLQESPDQVFAPRGELRGPRHRWWLRSCPRRRPPPDVHAQAVPHGLWGRGFARPRVARPGPGGSHHQRSARDAEQPGLLRPVLRPGHPAHQGHTGGDRDHDCPRLPKR